MCNEIKAAAPAWTEEERGEAVQETGEQWGKAAGGGESGKQMESGKKDIFPLAFY